MIMTEKVGTKYAQNARFVGRKSVHGPLNDLNWSHLVSDLQTSLPQASTKTSNQNEELRCNVEFSERHLVLTYIKKDEGFESDGESTKSNEAVKIVFNDDTSSANSSASDSDDLAKSSTSTSASASPTADLAKYKFDHKESYNISDVVICHAASNNVIWVIRTPTKSDLEAMVIECSSEEEAKHLYKKFLDVSKRSKLERHRRRKSDGGSVVARSMEAIFKRDKSQEPADDRALRYSLVQHTDRNGITHIEVEQPKSLMISDQKMGPSQQLVAKLRSSRSSAAAKKPSEKSKFAKELESILSKEIESRKVLTHSRPPGESLSLRQRAPALLLKKLDEFEEKANAVWAKAEAAAALQAETEANKKVWNKPTVVIDPSKMASRTPPPRSKIDNQRKERLSRIKAELLSSSSIPSAPSTPKVLGHHQLPAISSAAMSMTAMPVNTSTADTSADSNVNKTPSNQILVPTKTGKEPVKKLYPKDQAIPELMPRAPPVPNPGAPRFILALPSPMQFQAAHPAHHAHHHHQPHSLPFYPVMTPHWARFPGAGATPQSGDFNDTNNNMGHLWSAVPLQRAPHHVSAVEHNNPRGRSRDRGKLGIDPDQRRRAQSKSPARVGLGNSSNGHEKDISGGLTRKFREFGDAFRQKISRKTGNANISLHSGSGQNGDTIDGQPAKSNLKKKDSDVPQQQIDTNIDNKKVHFNKFATVQMME